MTHYEIFRSCFPALRLSGEQYAQLAREQDCRVFDRPEGFALVKGNELRLICVLPGGRGKGVGGALLAEAEEYARGQGFTRLEAGGSGSELFIGVPEDQCGFFERRGYSFGGLVAEMSGGSELRLNDLPRSGAEFRLVSGSDSRVLEAVRSVDADWAQYFPGTETLCAFVGGGIASFCILGTDELCILSGCGRMGSVGCVGTVPAYRRRGIGLEMVADGSRRLLERCCERIFIHYTAVYDWYAGLGYRTELMLRLGGKEL